MSDSKKIKVLVEIDEELYKNVVEHTKTGYIGSDVWIAVANGKPYDEAEVWRKSNELLEKRLAYLGNQTGDAISRSWVKHNVLPLVDTETRIYAEAKLNDAPAVEVRPKGKWEHCIEEDNDVECPFCGFQEDGIYYNLCPGCGADMRGDKENG